jgi:hypothetical protein
MNNQLIVISLSPDHNTTTIIESLEIQTLAEAVDFNLTYLLNNLFIVDSQY